MSETLKYVRVRHGRARLKMYSVFAYMCLIYIVYGLVPSGTVRASPDHTMHHTRGHVNACVDGTYP